MTPADPPRRSGLTIRVRLTLLYAGAFFIAGAALVAGLTIYFGHSLSNELSAHLAATDQLRNHPGHDLAPQLLDQLRTQYQLDHDITLRRVVHAAAASLAVLGFAATAGGWLLAGRVLHPLRVITATARRIAEGNLGERIVLRGPSDEITDLADTFNAMLERLGRAFDSQRRFVANASHELRTPLTINRTLIEVALDDPDASEATRQLGNHLLEVNSRQERLIDGLLTLASSQEQLTARLPTDLADVAARAAAESQVAAAGRGIDIRTRLAPAQVVGDHILLERLAYNLVDNAVRYNLADDGWVDITTGINGGHAELTVENPGPHIPDAEVSGLFEPFRRLATSDGLPSGVGLGLSIVGSVAHAHGGDVRATARSDGGLTVSVRIRRLRLDGRAGVG